MYPLEVSCLMERRSLAPYGLHGGEEGARGVNKWIYKSPSGGYKSKSLGGKCTVQVSKGDRVIINTPGGGGYGCAESNGQSSSGNKEVSNGVQYPIKRATPSRLTGSVGMRDHIQTTN